MTRSAACLYVRFAVVVSFFLLLIACEREVAGNRPIVVVTIPPQAYLIERMTGDLIDVRTMVAPRQSAEEYQPLPQQLAAIDGASYYFSIGMPFESIWLPKILQAQPATEIVPMHAGLESAAGDPHYWTDPRQAIVLADNAYVRLQTIFPGPPETLANNYRSLVEELQQLDLRIGRLVADRAKRRFLVYHPAWSHFAARYGLQQIAFERDGKEPGARYLAELLALCRENDVKTIFVQPQSSLEHARHFARELDAGLVSIDPLRYDYPDTLWEFANAVTGTLW